MRSCDTSPPLSPYTPTFRLGPGFWATVPESQRADVMRHHLRRAWQVIDYYHLPLPTNQERLELVVQLALEAELLFFNAAISDPSLDEHDLFFADFLRYALRSASEGIQESEIPSLSP